ncbi:MAG: hypothetical protein JO359_00430, partial [Candidatus Eremiobacteraeota bacterium]|nr:hypothetical protein [Candidatus Eremiobacteraeota bacterium]
MRKHLKNTTRTSLATATIAALLAGCSGGGGSQSVMPKQSSPGGPAPVQATGQSLTKSTLDLHKLTIPSTAT